MTDLTEVSDGETALRAVEHDWNAAAKDWNSAGLVALYTMMRFFMADVPATRWGMRRCVSILTPMSARLLPLAGIVTVTVEELRMDQGVEPHAAATASCQRAVASARKALSVDREMRVALKVERVMDGSVHIEKAPGGASRLEPLHFTLSSPHELVGILGAIVRPQPLHMRAG